MTNRNRVLKILRSKRGHKFTIGQIVEADPSGKLTRPKVERACDELLSVRTGANVLCHEDGSWSLAT